MSPKTKSDVVANLRREVAENQKQINSIHASMPLALIENELTGRERCRSMPGVSHRSIQRLRREPSPTDPLTKRFRSFASGFPVIRLIGVQ